ncbi:MAG: hypothetical protein FWF82_00475 [Oscillospiraceae bacterium]|nr:hypothetical protein [Oscillospiraceae bacterium]
MGFHPIPQNLRRGTRLDFRRYGGGLNEDSTPYPKICGGRPALIFAAMAAV